VLQPDFRFRLLEVDGKCEYYLFSSALQIAIPELNFPKERHFLYAAQVILLKCNYWSKVAERNILVQGAIWEIGTPFLHVGFEVFTVVVYMDLYHQGYNCV
jgi:hypothetical protein